MLYISRFVGQSKYGVVDTDDGSETVVTYKELCEYALDLGMHIEGVNVVTETVRGRARLAIRGISAVQDVATVSNSQTKLKILRGIDIKTYNGKIVSMTAEKGVAQAGTRVRLSDYGNECGEYIFKSMLFGYSGAQYTGSIIVVLDDKVKITSKSLRDFHDHGVTLDMTEVTNKDVIEYVCRELSRAHMAVKFMSQYVIDIQPRMDYYIACALLNRDANVNPKVDKLSELVSDVPAVTELITKRFRTEFLSLSNGVLRPVDKSSWVGTSKTFYMTVCGVDFGSYSIKDFNILRHSEIMLMFGALTELTTCNKAVVKRFENYIWFFDASKELQVAFIRLLKKTCEMVYLRGRERKWPRG